MQILHVIYFYFYLGFKLCKTTKKTKNKPCLFPFKAYGMLIYECVYDVCSIKNDENGESLEVGECHKDCYSG